MSEVLYVLWVFLLLAVGGALQWLILTLFFQPKRILDALRGRGRRSGRPVEQESDLESEP